MRVRVPPSAPSIPGSTLKKIDLDQNPKIFDLLKKFKETSGVPVLLNTSLNIKGEPMVNTWDDAVNFMRETDVCVF